MSSDVLSDLQCALAVQGGVTLAGYLAGITGILGSGGTPVIASFVSQIALPALLVQSMATADLSSIRPCFLLSMLASKGSLLVLGCIVGSSFLTGSRSE